MQYAVAASKQKVVAGAHRPLVLHGFAIAFGAGSKVVSDRF
jgi:hypothetical protein